MINSIDGRCCARTVWALVLIFATIPLPGQTGQNVGNFTLQDTRGETHSLSDYAGRIVVLEFWSFKCPVVLAYGERVARLQEKYRGRGVAVLGVASSRNESPEEVRRNADNLGLSYPVLLDVDRTLADRLGATHTPSFFVLDREGILRYRGIFDNNKQPGDRGRIAYVEDALDALLAGRPVPDAETKDSGCALRNNPL